MTVSTIRNQIHAAHYDQKKAIGERNQVFLFIIKKDLVHHVDAPEKSTFTYGCGCNAINNQ